MYSNKVHTCVFSIVNVKLNGGLKLLFLNAIKIDESVTPVVHVWSE